MKPYTVSTLPLRSSTYSLYSATKKLHSFSAIHAVHATTIIDIWESVMRTLKKASKVPDEVSCYWLDSENSFLIRQFLHFYSLSL